MKGFDRYPGWLIRYPIRVLIHEAVGLFGMSLSIFSPLTIAIWIKSLITINFYFFLLFWSKCLLPTISLRPDSFLRSHRSGLTLFRTTIGPATHSGPDRVISSFLHYRVPSIEWYGYVRTQKWWKKNKERRKWWGCREATAAKRRQRHRRVAQQKKSRLTNHLRKYKV